MKKIERNNECGRIYDSVNKDIAILPWVHKLKLKLVWLTFVIAAKYW